MRKLAPKCRAVRAFGVASSAGWKLKLEQSPLIARQQSDRSAVTGHDRLHDRKPHSRPAGIAARSEEGVEDPFPVRLGDRVAVIANRHPDGRKLLGRFE